MGETSRFILWAFPWFFVPLQHKNKLFTLWGRPLFDASAHCLPSCSPPVPRRAVGQDGAHQDGRQWPSQASPRLLLDSLEEDEVAAGEWRHKTGWWFPLPAKDFGTASLPPALVHSARWYLMRLYDTNAQLSGWTVKEVCKSQVFDVKNKIIHYLCTWTKATDMVIARRVKDKLSSTPAGVVLTTRDFGQESFPTLHTKRYPLSSISSVAWDNWSRIWRDEMYRKVVEMYCY